MHLVHVRVLVPDQCPASQELRDLFRARAVPAERVDHISVHPGENGLVTVGFFVTADALRTAEAVALAVAERTVADALRGARVIGCSGALVAEFYDRLVITPGRDGRTMRLPDQDTGQS
ncbi:hypothetical protein ACLB9X_28170 [Streptomyces sp. 5K101]|uniref:hypothetical protein n=1 Tax=Streptomyces sp. 5K101 TaxID=3390037 RepID=UPI003976232C